MARLRLKYVHAFIDRHGKPRYYFRRAGFKHVRLPRLPGSLEFMDAYQAALDSGARIEVGATRSLPGTIAALVGAYLNSIGFKNLAVETQRSRRGILELRRYSVNPGSGWFVNMRIGGDYFVFYVAHSLLPALARDFCREVEQRSRQENNHILIPVERGIAPSAAKEGSAHPHANV